MTGNGALKGFTVDGRELWARDLQKDYGAFGLQWGYGSSPLLEGDVLYVVVLHGMHTKEPSYLLGLEPATGKTRFRVERRTPAIRESPDAYTTPAVARRDGKAEIVLTGADVVTGHDPAMGQELVAPTASTPCSCSAPSAAAMESHLLLIPRPTPTPATGGTHLDATDRGVLCLDVRTGKPYYWPERPAVGTCSASRLLADRKLYVTNEDGLTTVLKAGPAFERLADNPLPGFTLSSPVAASGQLFLRTKEARFCIGEKAS
jgi:hypothetical protein